MPLTIEERKASLRQQIADEKERIAKKKRVSKSDETSLIKGLEEPITKETAKELIKDEPIIKAARETGEFFKGAKEEPVATAGGLVEGALTPLGDSSKRFKPVEFPKFSEEKQEEITKGLGGDFEKETPEEKAKQAEIEKIESRAEGVGRFASKTGIGLAASTLVPGSGTALGTLGQGVAANVPFSLGALEEGGTKGLVKDMALNTAIDLATLGIGKAVPGIKTAIIKKFGKEVTEEVAEKIAKEAFEQVQKEGAETVAKKLSKKATPKKVKLDLEPKVSTVSGKPLDVSKVKQPGLPFLKDLDEASSRAIQQPKAKNTIDLGKYADQVKAKKKNIDAKTSFALAGDNAANAHKWLGDTKKKIGKEIGDIVKKNPDARIDISGAAADFVDMVEKRLGGTFDEAGKIIDVPGGLLKDEAAGKEAEKVFKLLTGLSDEVPLEVATNIKSRMKNMLTKTPEGQLKPPSTVMNGIVEALGGNINNEIKNVVPDLAVANAKYSDIIDVSNRLGKVLGKNNKHGANVMKRSIESLAEGGIGSIFNDVKRISGGDYDLFQDAVYASIAAKLSGDVRQIKQALPFSGVASKKFGLLGDVGKAAKEKFVDPGALDRAVKLSEKAQKKNVGTLGRLLGNEKGSVLIADQAKKDNLKTIQSFTKKNKLSPDDITDMAKNIDLGGINGAKLTIGELKEKGITHIDGYHVLKKSDMENILKEGIDTSSWYNREDAVYFFADPDDIARAIPYLALKVSSDKGGDVVIAHFKVPVDNIKKMKWDGIFNSQFDTYSAFGIEEKILPSAIKKMVNYNIPSTKDFKAARGSTKLSPVLPATATTAAGTLGAIGALEARKRRNKKKDRFTGTLGKAL